MASTTREILSVTVGHKRPLFEIGPDARHLALIPSHPDDLIINKPSLAQLTDAQLSEYYMLFGLAHHLRVSSKNYTHISVSHYRRFIANVQAGTQSTNQAYTRIISPEVAGELYANHRIPLDGDWLIGQPITLASGGIFKQFARHHPITELFRLLVAAVDEKVLSNDFIKDMLNRDVFLPAPSACFLPKNYFLSIMEVLERTVQAVLKRGTYTEFDGYQKRIIAFCLERIHSHLILSILTKIPSKIVSVGYQYVVGDGDKVFASGR